MINFTNMRSKWYITFVGLALSWTVYSQQDTVLNIYNYKNPCAFYTLPDTLYEISGLTDVDSAHIGCVQDEKGMIFLYNLHEARIESHSTFYFDGDYEGITRVGPDMFVLRSDGYLFQMKDYMSGQVSLMDSFSTNIPITNNEGLCYDEKNERLLIAAKGKIKQSKDTKDLRFVYAFELEHMKMADSLAMVVDVNEIEKKMIELGIPIPTAQKKTGESRSNLKFMPSSLAVHPINDHYYILSAVDRILLEIQRNGDIVNVFQLDSVLFPKPEGITFLPNGDMMISNEGNGGKPNLMRFCYEGE